MTTSTMSRLHRLRKLAYAPLIAAVAAGALCTGAGVALAAPTDTPQSGSAYNWQLLNHTGQPIYGYWGAEMASGDTSRVETDADHLWKPDDASVKATMHQSVLHNTTWKGHICINKHWWDFTDSERDFRGGKAGTLIFRLEADSKGAPFVYYQPSLWEPQKKPLKLQQGDC
ncbi:hypothetical protein [Rhodococcus jostii]|uniref:hypothetical protein n=1 Tax=Rhodococcus jostii TaxID=132919 RepID=UPI00362FBA28